MSLINKNKLKYVYLVDMSAQREGAHCQCHVLGVHRTLQSALRHYKEVRTDRLSARHFIKEFWHTDFPEIVPRDNPSKKMRSFYHESWYTDDKRETCTECITVTRRLLSPSGRRFDRVINKQD